MTYNMFNIKSFLLSIAIIGSIFGLSSCNDSFIFEGEGDCASSTSVQFVFKKHRQALHSVPGRESDAFYSTVSSVHLFVFDETTDELVFEKIEKTENLKSAAELGYGTGTDRCYLPLDLKPGKYRMVAWCGLDESDHNNAFNLTDGSRALRYKECSVKFDGDMSRPVSHEKYESIYHGSLGSVEITANNGENRVFPIALTKDNNDIAVYVQHTSASFAEGDYTVVYTDANGSMHFDDNSLTSTDKLEYHPHSTSILTSSTEYNGDKVEPGALVAHISTSRLMNANKNDARLEVRDREGRTVFSIPFIQYLLEMQTFTSDGQYYLDCEDTYNCSFYLSGDNGKDESGEYWVPARIIINNWVKVPDQNENV